MVTPGSKTVVEVSVPDGVVVDPVLPPDSPSVVDAVSPSVVLAVAEVPVESVDVVAVEAPDVDRFCQHLGVDDAVNGFPLIVLVDDSLRPFEITVFQGVQRVENRLLDEPTHQN